MQAFGELLMKVDSRQITFGPKRTVVVAVIFVSLSLSVIVRTLLEFIFGSKTVFNVAFPIYGRFSINGGTSGFWIRLPVVMVRWFKVK